MSREGFCFCFLKNANAFDKESHLKDLISFPKHLTNKAVVQRQSVLTQPLCSSQFQWGHIQLRLARGRALSGSRDRPSLQDTNPLLASHFQAPLMSTPHPAPNLHPPSPPQPPSFPHPSISGGLLPYPGRGVLFQAEIQLQIMFPPPPTFSF